MLKIQRKLKKSLQSYGIKYIFAERKKRGEAMQESQQQQPIGKAKAKAETKAKSNQPRRLSR